MFEILHPYINKNIHIMSCDLQVTLVRYKHVNYPPSLSRVSGEGESIAQFKINVTFKLFTKCFP